MSRAPRRPVPCRVCRRTVMSPSVIPAYVICSTCYAYQQARKYAELALMWAQRAKDRAAKDGKQESII